MKYQNLLGYHIRNCLHKCDKIHMSANLGIAKSTLQGIWVFWSENWLQLQDS